ncbi:putative 2OG-Fe(II) oxygenase [Alteromonas facilis]|uniref:putative 2OG-Fe(II) oxygenase n=1 Tax=Alteromonas facilis TaxID=2048004 RepID=UPI000C28E4A9|nr:tetratricopeptide repeat protein [Alteromonas facilis]
MSTQLNNQIISAYQQGNYAQVMQWFGNYSSIKQCDPNVGICFANSQRHTGDVKSAKRTFEVLLKRFPQVPAIFNSYANLCIAQGHYAEASRLLKSSIRLDANYFDAYVNLGRLQNLQENFAHAEASYNNALKLQPQNLNAKLGLAAALHKQSKYQSAESIYQMLLSMPHGTDVKVLINYASLLRDMQRYQDAVNILQHAIQALPDNAMVHAMLAANYALQQRMDDAYRHYQQAITIEPTNTTYQIEFAHFRWSQGSEAPFEPLLAVIFSGRYTYELVISALDLLTNAEQFTLVKKVLEACAKEYANDPTVLMFAARYERMVGDLTEAEALCQQAIKNSSKPIPVSIENEMGYIALAQQNAKDALKVYRNLQRREPENQGWWTLYSTALKLTQSNSDEYARLCDYSLLHSASVVADKGQDYLRQLTAKLEAVHANTRHPIGQSLRNGTQTYEDIFDDTDDVIQTLKTWIHEQAERHTKALKRNHKHPFLRRVGADLDFTGSWSVCLKTGGYHTSHFHPQGWLSGVFYVDVPEDVDSQGQGWLQFGVPEISQLALAADYAIKPESGRLMLFPSFMWHGTRPFNSGNRRMTIAFDMVPKR